MEPEWLQNIKLQIEYQINHIERPWETIITAYNETLNREEVLDDENGNMEDQIRILHNRLSVAQRELEELKSEGGGIESKKYQELDVKYRTLKKEQMELLKTQSTNSSRLLELTEQVKIQERKRDKIEKELTNVDVRKEEYEKRLEYFENLIGEKNFNIEILHDELQALQLELLHTDERVKALEKENRQLVERWLSKVNEEVEHMNEEIGQSGTLSPGARSPGIALQELAKFTLPRSPLRGVILSKARNVFYPVVDFDAVTSIPAPVVPQYSLDFSKAGIELMEEHPALSIPSQLLSSHMPEMGITANRIACNAWSRNGDFLIASTRDFPELVHVWKAATGKVVSSLNLSSGSTLIGFCPIGSTNDAMVALVSNATAADGTADEVIKLFDIPRSFCLWTEPIESGTIQLQQLNEGDLSATLSRDGKIVIWDIKSRKAIHKSDNHLPRILRLTTGPANNLYGITERSLILLDTLSLRPISAINLSSSCNHQSLLDVSEDYAAVCTSRNNVYVVPVNRSGFGALSNLYSFKDPIESLNLLANQNILVSDSFGNINVLKVI